jgi:molybdate transport system substrate-binding protein
MQTKSLGLMLLIACCATNVLPGSSGAAEIKVMSSGGFRAAYLSLAPEFERTTGHKLVSIWGGSMGSAPTTIPNRLKAGEAADVVILAGSSLDDLIKEGQVVAGSRTDLARSIIGVAVRAGAPKPDISSTASIIRALDQAKSISYSSSASGVYLAGLFRRLGIADRLGSRIIVADGPVGSVVARGEAEIGFQQVSELLPIPGIDYVGPLPAEIQEVTIFSAGIAANAKEAEGGRALVRFLTSTAAAPLVKKSGMDPVHGQ